MNGTDSRAVIKVVIGLRPGSEQPRPNHQRRRSEDGLPRANLRQMPGLTAETVSPFEQSRSVGEEDTFARGLMWRWMLSWFVSGQLSYMGHVSDSRTFWA